jgi:hypothetical protein
MSEACTNIPVSGILVRAAQATTVVLVALAMSALYKALSLQAAADASIAAGGASVKKEAKASANLALTQHQQTLLGLPVNGPKKPAVEKGEAGSSGDSTGIKNVRQRPPWVRFVGYKGKPCCKLRPCFILISLRNHQHPGSSLLFTGEVSRNSSLVCANL